MKQIELTIAQACEHPECFMYVWVTDAFLNAINKKYANIIRIKRANQKKVLMLSADKYLGGYDKVNQYYDEIKKAFEETYGMSPYDALIVLAQGGSVAGKNWSEGMYGVGALPTSTFKGITTSDGSTVSVDKKTGHIFYGNKDITDESLTSYNNVKGEVIPFLLYGKDDFGYLYESKYNKTYKGYYAQTWVDEEGVKHKATDGKVTNSSDSESIWGNINLDWDWLKNILNWILSIFGVPTIPDIDTNTKTLTAENTLPSQTADGFVQEAGMGEAGMILLALAAGGLLIGGGLKGKKKIVS